MNRRSVAAVWFCWFGLGGALATAGDAVFSRDGKAVYSLGSKGGPELERVDIRTGVRERIALEEMIGDGAVIGLARSKSGVILCATPEAVWAWDDVKGTAVLVSAAAEGKAITGIAYDPVKRRVLVTAVSEIEGGRKEFDLMVKRERSAEWETVRARRIDWMDGMEFASDGTFIFSARGDVWAGEIWEDVIPQRSEDPKRNADLAVEPGWVNSTVDAFRYAPLATVETDDGTPSQEGVAAVSASRRHLYAHLNRMGGSGYGTVVRLKIPEVRKAEGGKVDLVLDVGERAKLLSDALASVEVLGSEERNARMCVSPDGETMHYYADGSRWLVLGDAAPKKLVVSD